MAKTDLYSALRNAESPRRAPAREKAEPASSSSRGVTVTGYFDPSVRTQLKTMAAEEGTTLQELLREALNDLFAKRGRAEIA